MPKCLNVKIKEKGISIYLALMIMFILIAVALGVSLIIVSQMKMIRGMGDSVVAFFTADTGIENSLYEKRKIDGGDGIVSGSVGEASYNTVYEETCAEMKWKSIGSYKGIKRAIEITRLGDFSLTVNDPYLCIEIPGSDSTIVTVTFPGIPCDVTFSTSPLPPGFSPAVFSPDNICSAAEFTPSCSRNVTFTADGTAAGGTHPITIYGTADTILTQQVDIQLTISEIFPCPEPETGKL